MGLGFVFVAAALSSQTLTPPAGAPELESSMLELVNVEREARGLSPLAPSPPLAELARAYSRRMAATGKVHHELDRPVEDRIQDVLPGSCHFGENVSKHTSVQYSVGDMMLSPGHRANLLSGDFTLVGVGIVRGDDGFLYITLEMARPCDPPRSRSQRR